MRNYSRRQLAKTLALGAAAVQFPAGIAAAAESPKATSASVAAQEHVAWKEIMPGVWKATVGVPEKLTPVSMRTVPPALDGFHGLPAVAASPLPSAIGQVKHRGCLVRMPLAPEERIFGFGLQLLSFEQRGKKKMLRVNADPKADLGDTHAPVPIYVSNRGYAVLVDTARYVTFYGGDAHPVTAPVATEVSQSDVPEAAPSLKPQDTSEILVDIPHAGGVDVYLFAGPSMTQAVQRYNLFSGGGCVPPEWGLGFWYRMRSNATQSEVTTMANEFRERKIPCDVIGLEAGWQTHAYSCTFVWSKRFPEPAGFVKNLGSMNYKVNLWEHAFTHASSPLHGPLKPHSGDYAVWEGLVPDFASPQARSTFGEYHRKTFLDIGVSGFKLDECDNSDFTGGWSFPEASQFPSGLDGEQMHSVFGLRFQDALLKQFQLLGKPTYGLVRSSGALAAPYPFVLYSDLYDHRSFIRALANSGFSGLLWCPEVRDAKNEEDLLRRLQSTVFSPLAMINGWYIPNPPWKQVDRKKNNQGEFAAGWEDLEAKCRKIIGSRMQLVPYLRAAFAKYASDGTPPFRALVMDYPNDSGAWKIDDQYLIGDRVMVAPLFAGEPSRSIYLPAGEWCDFWTGVRLSGGQRIQVPSSSENIPVYIKAGSVFPVAAIGPSAEDAAARDLTVRIYGDGSLPFEFDDGSGEKFVLSWDRGMGKGSVVQPASSSRPYMIADWVQM